MITDWGGVLTSPIRDSVDAWLAADLIDPAAYRTVMRAWVTQAYRGGADNPIHQLERGEGDPSDFERALAAQLAPHRRGPGAGDRAARAGCSPARCRSRRCTT